MHSILRRRVDCGGFRPRIRLRAWSDTGSALSPGSREVRDSGADSRGGARNRYTGRADSTTHIQHRADTTCGSPCVGGCVGTWACHASLLWRLAQGHVMVKRILGIGSIRHDLVAQNVCARPGDDRACRLCGLKSDAGGCELEGPGHFGPGPGDWNQSWPRMLG